MSPRVDTLIRRVVRMASRLARPMAGPSAVVLMYHRVAQPMVDPWNLSVAPDLFDRQIAMLAKRYRLVPLDELPERLHRDRGGPPLVAVTFDDGYRDNLVVARPILEKHGCPATLFVTTGFIGWETPFWWDELAERVLCARRLPDRIALATVPGMTVQTDGHDRVDVLFAIWACLRKLSSPQRDAAMAELREALPGPMPADPNALPMGVDEIAAFAGPLFDIAAHTVTHPALTDLSLEAQTREIAESRIALERILDRPVSSFAYPYGDFDDGSVKAALDAGMKLACTTEPSSFGHRHPLLRVPRLQVKSIPPQELGLRIDSLIQLATPR